MMSAQLAILCCAGLFLLGNGAKHEAGRFDPGASSEHERPATTNTAVDAFEPEGAHYAYFWADGPTDQNPIVLSWQVLMDIDYELRYFGELDMEIYAPVFPARVKALDGKEVIVEGHVIPFYEEGDLVSLSYNPYASCFFCGNASPASVMSLYLKNSRKRYQLDEFKKFRGTLELNDDDPNEFYYILRDAIEEK